MRHPIVQSGTWITLGVAPFTVPACSLPDCLLTPIFKSRMISANPANAATINVGTVLRFLWCHTVTNSMQKRYRRGKIVAAVVASRTARASAGRNSGWSTEASAGPIMVTLAAVIRVADSQPREVTRLGFGHVGECSAATGDCAGCADCSICRVRNDGLFGHACGRACS